MPPDQYLRLSMYSAVANPKTMFRIPVIPDQIRVCSSALFKHLQMNCFVNALAAHMYA